MANKYNELEILKGDLSLRRDKLNEFIDIMRLSGYAVNVVPENEERVRVIITKGNFYD